MDRLTPAARQITFHAFVVLLLGMIAGFFWGLAMANPDSSASQQAAWRLAHIEGFANGVLMLGIALALPLIAPQGWAERIIRIGTIITGYSNILASLYGGLFNARGTMPTANSSPHDLVVFLGFTPGVLAIIAVILAALYSLRASRSRT